MKRKLWVLTLGFALCFVPLSRIAAQSPNSQSSNGQTDQPSKLDQEIAKIKAAISKRVADDKERVKLKLRDGSEVKGRLNQASDASFTITNDKGSQPMTFTYADVQKVNGRGLSRGAKIGIISAIVVGVFAILVIKAVRDFDPFKDGIRLQGVNF
jgi:hypothetical protein